MHQNLFYLFTRLGKRSTSCFSKNINAVFTSAETRKIIYRRSVDILIILFIMPLFLNVYLSLEKNNICFPYINKADTIYLS